jgi:histidine ammonia-lyase
MTFFLGDQTLTSDVLVGLAKVPSPSVEVGKGGFEKLKRHRAIVEKAVAGGKRIYGINTGFGYLSDITIENNQLKQLQYNLIRSHACGVGEKAAPETVRALLILRAHTFLLGHSGISHSCLEKTLAFLHHDILPVIPLQGSVGASGDLAPLAPLALGLIGEGDVVFRGQTMPAKDALKIVGIEPFDPEVKEGLSLCNGTHFMAVLGSFVLEKAKILLKAADVVAALSLDAFRGSKVAFDEKIQSIRPQAGQALVAENMRVLFAEGDEIMDSHQSCDRIQDPYSFRCIPQVHGASRGVFNYAQQTINAELNSVTDNPLVFDDGEVLSGGNFHGQPVAMILDFVAIALAELGSISERRTEKLTNPHLSRLPAFLIQDSGLNSGFMIPHVVAAALVSENKVLSHPACIDSIPTSADKEDHVSMGPIAALKADRICQNISRVLAIELLAACQGIDIHKPLKPSRPLRAIYGKVREMASFMEQDQSLHKEIEQVAEWILQGGINDTLSSVGVTIR